MDRDTSPASRDIEFYWMERNIVTGPQQKRSEAMLIKSLIWICRKESPGEWCQNVIRKVSHGQ